MLIDEKSSLVRGSFCYTVYFRFVYIWVLRRVE